jgi:hypothetical protein
MPVLNRDGKPCQDKGNRETREQEIEAQPRQEKFCFYNAFIMPL